MSRRVAQLLVGLFLYGFAIAMMLEGALGASPWDVLSQGVVLHTGLNFAIVTNAIGVVVLLLWIPIRQKPGVGTVANVLLIGPSIEVGLWMLPEPDSLVAQILLLAGGLVLLAIATGLYIGARFGPGPRDGLMTGIHRRTGWPIWAVRTSIEVTVLAIGWMLGGTVGLGTLAFALLIGPMVNVALPLLRVPGGDTHAAPAAATTPTPAPAGVTVGNSGVERPSPALSDGTLRP
ncbi:MAG: YczE/YyaS/YitT family protein [Rhodoglobus sp.]